MFDPGKRLHGRQSRRPSKSCNEFWTRCFIAGNDSSISSTIFAKAVTTSNARTNRFRYVTKELYVKSFTLAISISNKEYEFTSKPPKMLPTLWRNR